MDPRFGSPSTIIVLNLSAYTPDKPWVPLRSSPLSPTSSPHRQLPVPEHLSPTPQQQLKALFQEFSDIIGQGEDNLGCTPLLQHTIETEGPPLRQPYCCQNPAVRREEMAQVQQMLSSGVIHPSNSPWASLVVMVLCRLQATQRGHRKRRSSHPSHRRPPRRLARGPLVLHPQPEKRVLAGPHPGAR